MIKEEKIFNDWLCRELAKLHLEDEVYTNYVGTIMNDNSYEMEEKRDNAIEFLAAATEADLTQFGEELVQEWAKVDAAKKKHKEEEQRRKKEQNKPKVADLQPRKDTEQPQANKISKEERAKRQALLQQYSYQVETTDINGDLIFTENVGAAESADDLDKNDNTAKLVRAAQQERDKAKEKHLQKVARDKEMLVKEQLKKEKRKRKTEKREKRRF